MNGKQMAAALDLSEAMISKLRRRGMPMTDAAAATRWRRRNLDVARTKGMKMGTVAMAPARAAPARAAPAVQRPTVVDELVRVASAFEPEPRALPEPAAIYVRALLQATSHAQFRLIWAADEAPLAADVVDRVLPRSFMEWGWSDAACDDGSDLADSDLPMLHLLAAGLAEFEWDPAGPWPKFCDCIRPLAGGEIDLVAARREFEAFIATMPR